MQKLITCLVWLVLVHFSYAQIPGTLDLSFNPAENSFLGNGPNRMVRAAVQQPDGKFVIGGDFTEYNGVVVQKIARINLDGSLDQSFTASVSGADFGTSGEVRTIKLQADGKIIIGGAFTNINGLARPYLARLNSNGSTDEGFNPGGTGPDRPVNACIILPNDSIVIGGTFSSYNGLDAKLGVAFLGRNGVSGHTFNPSDNRYKNIAEMVLQPDGKILICGDIFFRNNSVVGLARLNVNRTIDNSLADFKGIVRAMVLQTDGKVLVAGSWAVANGQISPGIQRLLPGGSIDNTFNPGLGFRVNYPNQPNQFASPDRIILSDDGKILAAGRFSTYNGQPVGTLLRINADGSLDPSFTLSNEIPTYDPLNLSPHHVLTLIKTQNGKFLMGGSLSGTNENFRKNIFLVNPSGSLDRSFNPRRGFNNQVITTLVQPNGRILAGGNFTAYNDTIARFFTRLMPDGTLDRVFNNQLAINGHVFASALQPDGKILIAGKFTMVQGVRRNSVARLNSNGSLDAGFNMGGSANDSIKAIAVRPDGNIVIAGAFTKVGGAGEKNRIALLSSNGTLMPAFGGNGANGTINDLIALPDNSVAFGGRFNQFDGLENAHLVKLSANNIKTILNPSDFEGNINCIRPEATGTLMIAGKFTMALNGITQKSIARIPLSNTLNHENPFQVYSSRNLLNGDEIYNLLVQPDGRIIVVNHFSDVFNRTIVRLLPSGKLDNSFLSLSLSPDVPETIDHPENKSIRLALQTNGNLLITSNYTYIGNNSNPFAKPRRAGIASVNAYKPVPNDEPCNAINLVPDAAGVTSCNNPVSGTLMGALAPSFNVNPMPAPLVQQTNGFNDVWYKFTATSTSHFIKISFYIGGRPLAQLLKLDCSGKKIENVSPLIQKEFDPLSPSQMVMNAVNLMVDSVYYIRYMNPRAFTNFRPEDFDFNICVLTPGNDDACNAITVIPKPVGDTSSAEATVGTLYPSTFANGTSNGNIGDVWYKFKATAESHIIRAVGNGFQIRATIFKGAACGQLTPVSNLFIASQVGSPLFFGVDTLKTDSIYYLRFSSATTNIIPERAEYSFSVLTPFNNTPCTAAPIMPGLPGDSTTAFTEGSTFLSTFNGDISCSSPNANPDVWYRFSATAISHLLEVEKDAGTVINATVYTDTLCQSKGYSRITCLENNSKIKIRLTGLIIGKSYLVRIASFAGGRVKGAFKIRVLSPPANDEPCGAITLVPGAPLEPANPFLYNNIICSNPVTGSFVGSTKDNRYSSEGFRFINHDVWFKFFATASTHVINIRRNNYIGGGRSILSLYKGSNCDVLYASPSRLITQPTDNFSGSELFGFQHLMVGETYFIRLGINIPDINNDFYKPFDICVLTPINDTWQTATEIVPTFNCDSKVINTQVATPDSVIVEGKYHIYNDIWYRFKATSNSHTLTFSGVYPIKVKLGFIPTNDSIMQVYDSSSSANLSLGNITIGSNNLVPDSIYYVVIAQNAHLTNLGNFFAC